MTHGLRRSDDLCVLDDTVWVWTRPVGVPVYDFDFGAWFDVHHPQQWGEVEVVARVGAFDDFAQTRAALAELGLRSIHTEAEYLRATRLPEWYPLLEDLTPESLWFAGAPDREAVASTLGWPIFMKGARQTSRHRRRLSIIEGPEAFERALEAYAADPILSWQDVVCRRLVPLRRVEDPDPGRIPSSFEFRTFWWRGALVGFGRYWCEGRDYAATASERRGALEVAEEAARRVAVPFLVVDVAQTAAGEWIVIECNDGQESGYAGVSPFGLWQAVLARER